MMMIEFGCDCCGISAPVSELVRVDPDGLGAFDICFDCARDEERRLEPGDEYADQLAFEREHAAGVL